MQAGADGKAVAGEVAADEDSGRRGQAARRRRWWRWAVVLVVAVTVLLVGQATGALAATGGINEVKSFVTKLTGYVTAIAAAVAILFMAINGLRWVMSSGNALRQAEARQGLVAAAVGLAIVLSAGLIVNLVVAALK